MKYGLAMVLSLISPSFTAAFAHGSEWGCEVLLCAASSNPSWRGVASCHPPMEKLISAMKEPGFSWPTCPEGGASKPGYERYADCRAGWTPTAGENIRAPAGGDQAWCMRAVNQCNAGERFDGWWNGGTTQITPDGSTRIFSRTNTCFYIEYTARPLRNNPYYVDIRDGASGESSRFWFNLEQ